MFAITIRPEWTDADQDRVDHLMYGGSMEELRDRELAHRSRVPIAPFVTVHRPFTIEEAWEIHAHVSPGSEDEAEAEAMLASGCIEHHCPVCGSTAVEDECINDYGGTTSGWTSCLFCGYTTSWADLSAVI